MMITGTKFSFYIGTQLILFNMCFNFDDCFFLFSCNVPEFRCAAERAGYVGDNNIAVLDHTVSGCAAFIFRMAAFRFLSQLRIWISSSPCSKNRCVSFFALGIFITSLREYFSAPPLFGDFSTELIPLFCTGIEWKLFCEMNRP